MDNCGKGSRGEVALSAVDLRTPGCMRVSPGFLMGVGPVVALDEAKHSNLRC